MRFRKNTLKYSVQIVHCSPVSGPAFPGPPAEAAVHRAAEAHATEFRNKEAAQGAGAGGEGWRSPPAHSRPHLILLPP